MKCTARPNDQTEHGGADPAETERRKRKICTYKVEHAIEVQSADNTARQACAEVIERGEEREADDPAVDALVMPEELSAEGEEDEHDSQRIEEHQHGKRIADDVAQSEVCKTEGRQG